MAFLRLPHERPARLPHPRTARAWTYDPPMVLLHPGERHSAGAGLRSRGASARRFADCDGHRRAATALREIAHETFAEIARRVRANLPCTEFLIQRLVLERIAAHGMRTDEAPIVAVNANAANPHFSVTEKTDTPIRRGDLVLLDLFAKETAPDSIYGDLTWMGFVGERVPDEYARTFAIVARARDAAVELIQSRVGERQPVS